MSNQTNQFCTFHVADLYLGINVRQVQEVIRHCAMTRVPRGSKAIGGLINLRGQIVTALDLRFQLGLPARAANQLPMNVLVQEGDNVVSLLVDSIGDVVEVDEELFELPPATIRADVRDFVLGTYKFPDRLLLALNISRAIQVNEDTALLKTA